MMASPSVAGFACPQSAVPYIARWLRIRRGNTIIDLYTNARGIKPNGRPFNRHIIDRKTLPFIGGYGKFFVEENQDQQTTRTSACLCVCVR